MLIRRRNLRKRQPLSSTILVKFLRPFQYSRSWLAPLTSFASKEPRYRASDDRFFCIDAGRILAIRLIPFADTHDVVGDGGHKYRPGALILVPAITDFLFHLAREQKDIF